MLKGILLALLLCCKRLVVGGVGDHGSSVGLRGCVGTGLYRERRGGRNNKYKQTIITQSMTWRYAVPGVS